MNFYYHNLGFLTLGINPLDILTDISNITSGVPPKIEIY